MKKRLLIPILLLAALCLCGTAMAEVAGPSQAACSHSWRLDDPISGATCEEPGWAYFECTKCGMGEEHAIKAQGHSYGEWIVREPATCRAEGKKVRYCASCQKEESASIAKTEHTWGEWKQTQAPTCAAVGTDTTVCTVCGATKTRDVSKVGHTWSAWTQKEAPTCTSEGTEVCACTVCGNTQKRAVAKLPHKYGEYVVKKAPTCTATGKSVSTCRTCTANVVKKLPKIDHDYGDWTITKEATDHTKGKRTRKCLTCSRKQTEDYYPEGTLGKGIDCDEAEVAELQRLLTAAGLYSKKITGKFDNNTASAVKKFQKLNKLKEDGIAWPQTRRLLGFGAKAGEPIMPEKLDSYKLQLTAVQTSPVQEVYMPGDVVTFAWTLKNASTKYAAKNVHVYTFAGMVSNSKTDTPIADVEDMSKGDTRTGVFSYTVTAEDAVKGSFALGFVAHGKLNKSNAASNTVGFTSPAFEGGIGGDWTPPVDPNAAALTLTKTVVSTPENGYHYVKGEEIVFRVDITNPGPADVTGVIWSDDIVPTAGADIGTLGAGKQVSSVVKYKVRAADVSAGSVTNTVTVSYHKPDGTLGEQKASAAATTGLPIDGPILYKNVKNMPVNGRFFQPGELICFEITIVNPTSETYTALRLYDLMLGSDCQATYKTLNPGESVSFQFVWYVTEVQAAQKSLTNTAKVTYRAPSLVDRTSVSNQCVVPVGFTDQDNVTITKTIISTPENGRYYQDGEEIRYEITVTNNTLQDLTGVDIRDSLAIPDANGLRTVISGLTIKAMESYSVHFAYPVGPVSVEATRVLNQASVAWQPVAGFEVQNFSEIVKAPTAGVAMERSAKQPQLAGDACEKVLTASGEGVAWHDVSECNEHAGTAEQAMTAPEKAEELWRSDIEALYTEWLSEADGDGQLIIEDDQLSFESQLNAWDRSLGLITDADTSELLVTDELMNKTVGLCYELHTAPEDRPDSIDAEHTALGAADEAAECSRSVSYGKAGEAHYITCQCELHRMTSEITNELLACAVDAEDREQAWIRTQSNWLLELNSMYDAWYRSAGSDDRRIIAADRMSFDRALNARKAALAELYPNDPATAAEVLASIIMERTQTMCALLHDAGILTK